MVSALELRILSFVGSESTGGAELLALVALEFCVSRALRWGMAEKAELLVIRALELRLSRFLGRECTGDAELLALAALELRILHAW